MAYRLTYEANVEWVGPGMGPLGNPGGPNQPGGNAQTLYFPNTVSNTYPPTSTTFTSTDITNLLTSMTTDLTAQMTAAISRVQGFSSGGG